MSNTIFRSKQSKDNWQYSGPTYQCILCKDHTTEPVSVDEFKLLFSRCYTIHLLSLKRKTSSTSEAIVAKFLSFHLNKIALVPFYSKLYSKIHLLCCLNDLISFNRFPSIQFKITEK